MVFESFSETGFGHLRFNAGGTDGDTTSRLSEILPILMHLEDKATLTVDRIPSDRLQQIVEIAADGPVQVCWEEKGSSLGTVSLRQRTMSLSKTRPCGLRDVIFFACLMRTYSHLPTPEQTPLREQFELTWKHLIDALPQCLTYCSTANEAEAEFGYSPNTEAGNRLGNGQSKPASTAKKAQP